MERSEDLMIGEGRKYELECKGNGTEHSGRCEGYLGVYELSSAILLIHNRCLYDAFR